MRNRYVYNDVAARYIRIYGGRKEEEWIAVDDSITYLYNKDDIIIGRVWSYHNFKKPKHDTDNINYEEIPY